MIVVQRWDEDFEFEENVGIMNRMFWYTAACSQTNIWWKWVWSRGGRWNCRAFGSSASKIGEEICQYQWTPKGASNKINKIFCTICLKLVEISPQLHNLNVGCHLNTYSYFFHILTKVGFLIILRNETAKVLDQSKVFEMMRFPAWVMLNRPLTRQNGENEWRFTPLPPNGRKH